jgi:two-component system NtrC family sensor kinase
MLGYESEELIGRHGHSTWHHSKPDGTPFPAEECSINTLNRKGIRGADESIRFWKKDGTSFSVECASTPMCEGNAPVGSVVIFKDISERIAAEAALKESEEKYRLLVDSSPAGVYKADLKGSFLFVNRALSDIFEFDSPEEMMSENVLMRYKNPEERTVFVDLLKKSGRVRNYELHTLSKTGKAIHLLINATLEGETISGMVLNMTEQKRLEAQLRHSQKMEAIGTLAGGVAHDFNNILNVIMGFGSLALNRIEEAHPATEHLKEVLASAERAANLTQRLLAFSRKQVTEMKPVDLNEVVKGTEKMLSRIIGEDIELITDLAGEELLVMADIGQMEQVLINLASNARDAMPRGGSLAIGTGRRELDNGFVAAHGYGKPGHYALVSFTDTGAGMNEETQKKIFEPFFTTKEIGEGTGLGLPIAYGIIKQHNGFINVYSEVGNGTTFKILMPLLDKSEEPVQEAGVAVSLRGGAETILIAEDDGALRDLSRIILESFGYRVMTAVDGEDAIRVFMEHRDDIHLVILDMIMPKKNGKEAYEEIRNASPTIKALFTSGYTMDLITRRELLTEGMDCIFKPILPKDLLKKVREVLDR